MRAYNFQRTVTNIEKLQEMIRHEVCYNNYHKKLVEGGDKHKLHNRRARNSNPIFNINFPDRTAELRKYGFTGRRLGPVQMTTDTAVRVTRIVVEDKGLSFCLYIIRKPSYSVFLFTGRERLISRHNVLNTTIYIYIHIHLSNITYHDQSRSTKSNTSTILS